MSVFPANELVRGHFGDRCAGLIAAVSAAYATLLVVTTVEESELPKIEPLTVYHDATAVHYRHEYY